MDQKEKDSILSSEKQWAEDKDLMQRKLKIKKEKQELKESYRKRLSTSKLLILFLFINCSIIEFFTGWVTIKSIELAQLNMMNPDFLPLVTLIGAVVSEVIGFAIYAIKSARENTAGGIVYETTMNKILHPDIEG